MYDEDTGLYYLRSRYYNPVLERFVNADGLIGGNLYSYCYNAPTSNIDPTGRSYEPYESIVYNNSNSTVKMLTKGNPSFPYAAGNEWYYLPNNTWVNIIEDGSGMFVKAEYTTQSGTYTGWINKEFVDVSLSNMTAAEAFDNRTIIAPNADLRKDYGFRGNVANIQHYLNRYYYYQHGERHHLRTDGTIDDETRRIVFEFQQFYHDNFDSNLKPDGYFGKETGNALHDYIEYELNSRG